MGSDHDGARWLDGGCHTVLFWGMGLLVVKAKKKLLIRS